MRAHSNDGGFSLVEVIVALFLFGLISLAILPAMITGLRVAAEQSSVAAATRHVHALVEEVRANPTCTSLRSAAAPRGFRDGRGQTLTSSARAIGGGELTCAAGVPARVEFRVVTDAGVELFSVDAVVLIEASL